MLEIREQQHHLTKVFILNGKFCRDTTSGLQSHIMGAQETGCRHLILDFAGVTIMVRGI